jgi:hypothetical protein
MTRSILSGALLLSVLCGAATGSTQLKLERAANNLVYYSGTIVVSGAFTIRLDETSVQLIGKRVCFLPEGETRKLIPRDNDRRTPWFCFSNQAVAEKLLQIPEQENGSCGVTGTAEIVISDYMVDKAEGDVFDTAKLVKIISRSTPSQLPCN